MARYNNNPINNYLYFIVASLFLVSTAINVRYRYDLEIEPHIGGADFAIPLFIFVSILSIPLLPGVLRSIKYVADIKVLFFFFMLYTIPTIVGIVNAPFIEYSYVELVRQVFVILMICIFIVILHTQSASWLYAGLAVLTLIQAIAVLVQFLGIPIPFISNEGAHFLNESVDRFAGFQGHPNILGALMNVIAAFMLVGLFYKSNLPRLFFLFFYILSAILVLLTVSRAGLLVLLFSSTYIIVRARGANIFTKKYLAYSGLALLGIVFFFVFGDGFQHRIFDGLSTNISSRVILNNIAFTAFLENPIIGAGSNNFIYYMTDYDSTSLSRFYKAPVHNVYLLIMAESGAVGIFAFLLMLGLLFSNFQRHRYSGNQKAGLLAAGAEAALVGVLVGSMFGYFYKQDVAQPLLALIFAISLCRFQIRRRRKYR